MKLVSHVPKRFPMARKTIYRIKVKELHDKGVKVVDIAAKLGCGNPNPLPREKEHKGMAL
jgi:hypothetical protein